MGANRAGNAHKDAWSCAHRAVTMCCVKLKSATRIPVPSAVARGSLCDGLVMCLALVGSDPERFERAAAVWHSRWCAQTPGVGFAESRAVLEALESLAGLDPALAAEALRSACGDTEGVDEVIDRWLAKRAQSAG
jgi:hypothetical protein